jgi:signal transduction histidine kinase
MVEDNGVGNPDEQNFSKSSPQKKPGMGLGLGIIKNIIENYKGTITFKQNMEKELALQFRFL